MRSQFNPQGGQTNKLFRYIWTTWSEWSLFTDVLSTKSVYHVNPTKKTTTTKKTLHFGISRTCSLKYCPSSGRDLLSCVSWTYSVNIYCSAFAFKSRWQFNPAIKQFYSSWCNVISSADTKECIWSKGAQIRHETHRSSLGSDGSLGGPISVFLHTTEDRAEKPNQTEDLGAHRAPIKAHRLICRWMRWHSLGLTRLSLLLFRCGLFFLPDGRRNETRPGPPTDCVSPQRIQKNITGKSNEFFAYIGYLWCLWWLCSSAQRRKNFVKKSTLR